MDTTRLMRQLAQGTTTLFHPLTMVGWVVAMVMFSLASPLAYPLPVRWFVMGTVVLMTIGIPLLFWLLVRLFGGRRKGEGMERRTSIMMLVLVALCYTCCGWVFDDIVVLYLVRKILYTSTAVVALLLLCELFYPLDYHTTALGALLGIMWMLLYVGNVELLVPFIVGIVVVGAVASSRLFLTEERVGAVVWGALVGFAFSATILIFI